MVIGRDGNGWGLNGDPPIPTLVNVGFSSLSARFALGTVFITLTRVWIGWVRVLAVLNQPHPIN